MMILIVDDYQPFRNTLKKWLNTTFTDYQILEAATSQEAVELAQANRPKVVLMDIALPDQNGIEATRQIKTAVPEAQVIMLTYLETERYQADAAAAGSTAYITKQQMHKQLMPLLQSLLSSSQTS